MNKGTLIIGGGVIGLAIGWKLLLRGEPVTLLEKGDTGREASWAAAGMLAPVGEVHFQEDQNLRLGMESMRRYPAFVEALESDAGMKVDYRREGGLSVSLHPDDTAELRHRFEYQQALELPVRWLRGGEAQEMEPALSPNVVAAVYSPDDHQVDNRKLVEALKAAFLKAGGALHEQTPVERLVLHENGAPSVLAGNREWRHQRLLLTAGSWSGMIPGLDGALRPWVRPVKGQILAIQAGPETLRHNIRTPDVYIVPRLDGRLIVGATVEEMGFDRTLTVGGIFELVRGAWRAIPAVYEMPLAETWCGFRPGSRDNAPIIGETEIPAFFIATGHYRNGILNTPVTAEVMSEIMLGGQPPEFLAPFSPLRFTE
ncbi:MAG: glycine oxidase ThiO [SAR324 cluster bacterium]|nr:glycine oxidase ThiO [SAR324 cluster bacterium]